jgi:hypothetical protein
MTITKSELRSDDQSPVHVPGVCVTRRSLMNKIVVASVAASVPTIAPAMPEGSMSTNDKRLIQAAAGMFAADAEIDRLHRTYGDDADSRDDYARTSQERAHHIETLIEVPANSAAGVEAKAHALRQRELMESDDYHRDVALSLADDVIDHGVALSFSAAPLQVKSTSATALVDRVRHLDRHWDELGDKITAVEEDDALRTEYGRRPIALIAWRNYSAIGGTEIDKARDEFLRNGIPAKVVQREYRAAKRREREKERAGEDWDRSVGLSEIRKEHDECSRECRTAWDALGKVKVASIADAAAIMNILRDRVRRFDEISDGWEVAAFMNASRFLVRAAA